LEARPELLADRWPDLVGDRQQQLLECWHGGFAELVTKHDDQDRHSWPDRADRNRQRSCCGRRAVRTKAMPHHVEELLHDGALAEGP
jgi:hypothetical protein